MKIEAIKQILKECEEGEVLLHTYVTHRRSRQFELFGFPGMDQVSYGHSRRTGRPAGSVESGETIKESV